MAALAASAIAAIAANKDFPQVPFGPFKAVPIEIAWGSNSSGDTASVPASQFGGGKILGIYGGGHVGVGSLPATSVTITSKAASLGTQPMLLLLDVGR